MIDEKNVSRGPVQFGQDLPRQMLAKATNHHIAGQAAEAEKYYRAIIASTEANADANYGLGLLCASQGRFLEAINYYRHSIIIRPDFVDAYINLGTALLALGNCEEAASTYRQAIAIDPQNAMAHSNLGKALLDLGKVDEAIGEYREAISRAPDDPIPHANLGAALLELKAWESSLLPTGRAIQLQPDNALAHANQATALMHLGRRDDALAACYRAIASRPQGAVMHASLGGAMLELGALPEAIALCRKAVMLDPTKPQAYLNLSHALRAANELNEAAIAARQAIFLNPDVPEYHFHLAHILLLQGHLAAGWAEYEWRWRLPDFAWIRATHGQFSQPAWTGEDICENTILIYTEQGLGDIILFIRYLPMVVARAGRVIVAALPAMHRLLRSMKGLTIVSVYETPLPPFDLHCPLLSLPRIFGTTLNNIPASVPYLAIDERERSRWQNRIGHSSRLRVGIIWAGNPATKRDYFRSPGLANIMPLFSIPGVDFISLQVTVDPHGGNALLLPSEVLDLGSEVSDLADTAAIMTCLDLIISSCTAPLHLAGALGVRTWAMIPFAPYFPWLLDRTDSPWYPSMKLYRQAQPGRDWADVVDRMAVDLAELVRRGTSNSETRSEKTWSKSSARTSEDIVVPEPGDFNVLAHCRDGIMLHNRNDMYIGESLQRYGEFSAEETSLFRIIVRAGMTVIDIGANIGAHTIGLARLARREGAVHAFEPQRLTHQTLCANVALNSLTNVHTYHAAVGAEPGSLCVPFLDPLRPHNYGAVSLIDAREGERVPVVTIDGLNLAACHFMKLDIEGMEVEALRGAAATIACYRPILYVENDRESRSADLINLLRAYNYRLYWHLPSLFSEDNFRGVSENIFGGTVSVNMICIPAEIQQASLTNFREIAGPDDVWHQRPG